MTTRKSIVKRLVDNPHIGVRDIFRHAPELYVQGLQNDPEIGIRGVRNDGTDAGVVFTDERLAVIAGKERTVVLLK